VFPALRALCNCAARLARAGASRSKDGVAQSYLRPKTLFASFPAIADTARAKPLGKRFVLQRKFRATHSGPIFVGGVKQFSVASTVVEAPLRNKFSDFVLFLSILCRRRFNNRAWYSYEVALIINFSLKVKSILSL
jgi:hypothetical protein